MSEKPLLAPRPCLACLLVSAVISVTSVTNDTRNQGGPERRSERELANLLPVRFRSRRKEKCPSFWAGVRGQATAKRCGSPIYGSSFRPAKEFAGLESSHRPNSTISPRSTSWENSEGNRGSAPRVPLSWKAHASRCLTSLSNISFQPCVAPSRSGPAGIPACCSVTFVWPFSFSKVNVTSISSGRSALMP